MVTPFERVQVAWRGADREAALNSVVEALAAEGTPSAELDEALGRLLDDVRAAGADDETEEIINGVGDRLHGWCHASRHISAPGPAQRPALLNGSANQTEPPVPGRRPMAMNENYIGREQSLVKHYILQHYLERFAHIIGSKWTTITYVDCFSGPWQSRTADLSDTSFSIALGELRRARYTLAERNKPLAIRCFFLEESVVAHAQLQQYAREQADARIVTRNAALLDSIPDICSFIQQGGPDAFPFLFIDPTGWTGFDLERIAPLLQQQPGEVLINFMTEHIRRFVTPKETRAEIIDGFRRLFGADDVFTRISAISDARDREDELFTAYAERVREVGKFDCVCPAVVLHPTVDRTYFHLIYATRHRKGVEVFKKVEKDAFYVQEEIRAVAVERERVRETGQGSLFAEEEAKLPSHRAVELRERYLAAAFAQIEQLRRGQKRLPYDVIWDTMLAFPLVWEGDVKEWVADRQKKGQIRLLGLKPSQRVPQWEEGHEIEFLT